MFKFKLKFKFKFKLRFKRQLTRTNWGGSRDRPPQRPHPCSLLRASEAELSEVESLRINLEEEEGTIMVRSDEENEQC